MSTAKRKTLHAALVREIRLFIAGSILFNTKVAERTGLHLTDMQCLNLLELLGPVTPGTVAEWTGLTTGGVTVALDRLERKGLVRRERNPKDRRSVLVSVNAKALGKVNAFYEEIHRQMDRFLAETPEKDLETVVEFLSRMNGMRVRQG